jgi:hypothetical protein
MMETAMVRALGRVVEQGIIACDHGGVDACLQVSQPTQHTEGPPTDLLEDRGNVRMEDRKSTRPFRPVAAAHSTAWVSA